MATLTLAIPEELKRDLEQSPRINWSEVARNAIQQRVAQLKIVKAIAAKSKLTEEDALEIGRKINKSLHERLRREHPEAF